MLKRWLGITVTVGVVAGLVSSLAGLDVARAQAPVRIGVIEPLSGPVAASGNYIRMGAEIARDWLNAKGGVPGARSTWSSRTTSRIPRRRQARPRS